ncbi:MAG: hypothetical protein KJS92_07110 [Bacteroidetes bacterium]|nr:hypothetical protein [Bacteroidota bacterium]
MKRLFNYTLVCAAAGLAFLSACGEDDPIKPKPTLTLNSAAGYTSADVKSENGTKLKFGIVATAPSGEKLKQFTVKIATNGGIAAPLKDTTLNASSLNYDWTLTVNGSINDKITLTFIATLGNGETDSKAVTVTVIAPVENLSESAGQEVNNMIGPNAGAYNLVAGIQMRSDSSEARKDIKDMTTTSTSNTYTFSQSWTSGNGSKFVKVTAADYTAITTNQQLVDLWNAKSASAAATVTNIAKGDIILVKSGQNVVFPYFLVNVTDVVLTTGNNNDKYVFSYKGL